MAMEPGDNLDVFAAIHDGSVQVRAHVVAAAAEAHEARAKARLFRLHARQLIKDVRQLEEQTAVTVRQSELLLTDRT